MNSLPASRFSGASRSSLPCTLTLTSLLSIATRTPTLPDTSSCAPERTRIAPKVAGVVVATSSRVPAAALPADTASWPPVARVSEPPSKSTALPPTISMRDRSRRSVSVDRLSKFLPEVAAARARSWSSAAESLISASRWESSAVVLPSSSVTMAVTAPSPMRTVPLASLAEVSRWTVPRVLTVVVATATPFCRRSRPVSVMSPSRASSRPLLTTLPAVLSAMNCGATSLPRVVEKVLPSVPTPLRIRKLSPAASSAWPLRVAISPALETSVPSSIT